LGGVIEKLVYWINCTSMQVSIYEAKARLSSLIEQAEAGREVVVARRRKPVVRIVPVAGPRRTRVGSLAGRPYRMGDDFNRPEGSAALADDFGIAVP
jgi:prevent-host-death family protein